MGADPDVDVAIVGGGPAGALAALALTRAAAGRCRIAIIDRCPGPHAGRRWARFSHCAVDPAFPARGDHRLRPTVGP